MALEVILRGEGVIPAVTCSHPGGILDFGYVLEKESASQVLKVRPCILYLPITFISNWFTWLLHWLDKHLVIIARVVLISLQLQNSSLVTVGFRVQLASLCPSLSEDEADTVAGDKTKLNIKQFLSHNIWFWLINRYDIITNILSRLKIEFHISLFYIIVIILNNQINLNYKQKFSF